MQIAVSGQHITIGNPLQDYVKQRSQEVVQKYFENAISADIFFVKESFQFNCEIIVNDGTNKHVIVKSNANSNEIYDSFNIAVSKLEKQLRKYKSKLKNRFDRVKLSEISIPAVKYVISTKNAEDEEENIDNPVIIAEKAIITEELSVSEAVMKMDLENLPALMFKNVKNGRMNVVYYRKDGNISWVDY